MGSTRACHRLLMHGLHSAAAVRFTNCADVGLCALARPPAHACMLVNDLTFGPQLHRTKTDMDASLQMRFCGKCSSRHITDCRLATLQQGEPADGPEPVEPVHHTAVPSTPIRSITRREACPRRDITDCQLATLPPEISLLTSLHRLDAHSNRLAAVPPELGRLTRVNRLSLHNNELVALAEEVGDMCSLQWLCAPGPAANLRPSLHASRIVSKHLARERDALQRWAAQFGPSMQHSLAYGTAAASSVYRPVCMRLQIWRVRKSLLARKRRCLTWGNWLLCAGP